MQNILAVLAGTVAPVFAIVLLGAWLARREVIDPAALSRVTLYVLSPALVFSSLSASYVSVSDFTRLTLAVGALMSGLYLLGLLIGRMTRAADETRSAYLLSTVFMNAGNYGLPLVLFAFGEDGFAIGVLYFVAQAFCTNTIGAYIASRGKAAPREALLNSLRIPTLYAGIGALPFLLLHASPPGVILRPMELVGRAAIPLLLLVLGARLDLHPRALRTGLAPLAVATRLVVSPLLAALVVWAFSLRGETAAVFIVESAMPTAVTTVVLSMEFGSDTGFLASVIAYSTLLSVLSLSILIPIVR